MVIPTHETHHRTATVDGVEIFYREAGAPDAPAVLLLHGFPTSSHMFRNLIPALADRYRVIAPDYPGYGQSDMPDRTHFAYTFDHFAELIDGLLDSARRDPLRHVRHGLRRARRLAPGAQASRSHHRAHRAERQRVRRGAEGVLGSDQGLLARRLRRASPPARAGSSRPRPRSSSTPTVSRDVTRISPDNWVHDQALLDRPGNADIQLDLFYDYRTNLPLYPAVQAYFRERQPPTLIVWGKNDKIFPPDGAHPYQRDLRDVELHLLDTGHFALEDKADEMVPLIRDFLDRKVAHARTTSV